MRRLTARSRTLPPLFRQCLQGFLLVMPVSRRLKPKAYWQRNAKRSATFLDYLKSIRNFITAMKALMMFARYLRGLSRLRTPLSYASKPSVSARHWPWIAVKLRQSEYLPRQTLAITGRQMKRFLTSCAISPPSMQWSKTLQESR